MSQPSQQLQALKQAHELLGDLSSGREKRIPSLTRKRAASVLKHFPFDPELEQAWEPRLREERAMREGRHEEEYPQAHSELETIDGASFGLIEDAEEVAVALNEGEGQITHFVLGEGAGLIWINPAAVSFIRPVRSASEEAGP